MSELFYYLVPIAFVALVMIVHLRGRKRQTEAYVAVWNEAVESGLTEPPTLHPVVDLSVCMGSGACVRACPEKALGVIDGKGVLINPSHCIGHGACQPACPVGAIKLVFGTEKRGVEIPQVNPDFETNVPGLFIAGELGGMGLIRNAVAQGKEAIASIAHRPRGAAEYDVVIIGAGPSGIAASLAAKEHGLRYITIEQEDSLGGTTYHYPRNKLVMTAPMQLPGIGEVKMREVSKEELMVLWQSVLDRAQPNIHFSERMENIAREDGVFMVHSNRGSYRTAQVLLTIGRRGTPRKLGAPGEDHPKVVYRLIEAEQYRHKKVLVVGGGDSALEAALDVAAEAGTQVALSYRGNAFNRVKPKNRSRIEDAVSSGRITLMMESTIEEITAASVLLKLNGELLTLPNDALIVCAGGELPTPFLKKIGIQVEAHFGS